MFASDGVLDKRTLWLNKVSLGTPYTRQTGTFIIKSGPLWQLWLA